MPLIVLPSIILIIFIVGLPQLAETVYTPSLPHIACDLKTSANMVEFTLTIYLLAFALGTLFWGIISDRYGRKPCIITGFFIFLIGCIGCFFSYSIYTLMFFRFIQALGGSVGSVLGQAICRDSFPGSSLGKAYATISMALALFPALGPIIGGLITENFAWNFVFLFLMTVALLLNILIYVYLPETNLIKINTKNSLQKIFIDLFRDKKILSFGIIIGACNGIIFSFFAEGSFVLIEKLKLSPFQYGYSFIFISCATIIGGIIGKKLVQTTPLINIMEYGTQILLSTNIVCNVLMIMHAFFCFSNTILISIIIINQMISSFGICLITSNALSLALIDYKFHIGTASSLFGFFYYTVISFFTFLIGFLHNESLFLMPLYFLSLSVLIFITKKQCIS